MTDAVLEQALEYALRKELVSVTSVEEILPALSRSRVPGTRRLRRVLALRPDGARPTGSLLETLMIQLIRDVPGLPAPVRQHEVRVGGFKFYLDISWLELGLFLELDGQQHADQPVYDASRETAVVAATGWLCGRFTWREVVYVPVTTKRRLSALGERARGRPLIRR